MEGNTSPTPTPRSSKLPTILLVISALGLFATTALLAYQNVSLQDQITSLESKISSKSKLSPTLTPTPSISITPTIIVSRIFCGGIAGLACPEGSVCKIDGIYPDSAGTCEEIKTGTLVGKVIKSPTCAGPQRVGQVCEAPYPNGEFMLYREEGGGNVHLAEIKPVKTDSLGKFTTDLEPGNYELRNTATGIGKDLGSNGFHIYAGQTTPVTFYVDTGIR